MSPPLLPALLEEEYQPSGLLGEGGFGQVIRATRRADGAEVAIKLLREEMSDPEVRRRFEREARVTAKLRHPGVVGVRAAGVTPEGRAYIVYEFVEGRTLDGLVDLPEDRLREIGAAVAEALHAAHQSGVVHRDVKPANVLLRPDGSPVLCDFGVARSTAEGTVMTATGVLLGTPAFLAPELWTGVPAAPASDQWAWAACLYELLYGRPVYAGGDLSGIMESATSGQRSPFPPGKDGRVPSLAGPLSRALEPDPAARYPDMAAFADALRMDRSAPTRESRPDTGATVLLPGSAPATPSPAPARRGLLGAGFVLALGLGWALSGPGPEQAPPSPAPATEAPAPLPEAEEARLALAEFDRVRGTLHDFLPPRPPGKPIFMSLEERAAYLEPLAPRLMGDEFRSVWLNGNELFASWLKRVGEWHAADGSRQGVFELPGVREAFVERGLRDLRRMLENLWYLRYPRILHLTSVNLARRMLLQPDAGFQEYGLGIDAVRDQLARPPFAGEPLATALDVWLGSLYRDRILVERIGPASEMLGEAPLDVDRAWLLVVCTSAFLGDFYGISPRCPLYRQIAARGDRLLEKLPELGPLGPTPTKLRTALVGLCWYFHWRNRCDEVEAPEMVDILDRNLARLTARPEQGSELLVRWARWIVEDGSETRQKVALVAPPYIVERRRDLDRLVRLARPHTGR